MWKWQSLIGTLLVCGLLTGPKLKAQTNEIIYDDSLENGWQNWSWATVNVANTNPVHSGSESISVTASNWSALYLDIADMDVSQVTNLTFWINGGVGGQSVQVQAILGSSPQTNISLPPLPTNSWEQINLSMTDLGVAGATDFTGFWIQIRNNGAVPTFYVDDISLQFGPPPVVGTNATVTVQVDAAANRHSISPLIYGVAFASSNDLRDLNVPLNRSGGNATTRYNWTTNASNHASDWYFESLEESGNGPGGTDDEFISDSKNGGAQPMITMPIIGWVAKLGPNYRRLSSFSIAKYGLQSGNDWQYFPDAGNGVITNTTTDITNNDPTDANMTVDTNFQAGWLQHLTNLWGSAAQGGVRYYIMDNEWSIWHQTHRDVHPIGATMDEVLGKFVNYATLVKGVDSNALVAGPEEWGWSGYFYSGYDQQYGGLHGWSSLPDREAHGNEDYMPWLLGQISQQSQSTGNRLLDYFTLHYYPQSGEALSDDVSTSMQLLRNRSTRSLWDTNYVDESWINSVVMLIPRMKQWVATNYPGTKIGITEYNWGADDYPNGATAQADVLGIFGREGLDLATRWTVPTTGNPAYNAFKMFRNYDGSNSVFGDVSISVTVPDPDDLSAFGAIRSSDGKLTLIVVNKDPRNSTPVALNLTNLPASGPVQRWQLAASNGIVQLADTTFANGELNQLLPAQSVTLFVLPAETPYALRFDTNNPSGEIALWLDGQVGRTYALQSSSNLLNWSTISSNTLSSNSFPFTVPVTNSTQMFYRGLLIQP